MQSFALSSLDLVLLIVPVSLLEPLVNKVVIIVNIFQLASIFLYIQLVGVFFFLHH